MQTLELADSIRQGDRFALSKAITLIESDHKEDRLQAYGIIRSILPDAGASLRIGITGSPGVGKSTFIESFGMYITQQQKRLAVLTIDPSSRTTRGSILGDKTRMTELGRNSLAFIRPTAAGDSQGGVARTTRETIMLCEAAGFDLVVVETVGVGQSEFAVRDLVDFFLLLIHPGAGDELQGMKRGVMELADAIIVTRADGSNKAAGEKARTMYQNALQLFTPPDSGWNVPVQTCSALTGEGISEVWGVIMNFQRKSVESGSLKARRNQQDIKWFNDALDALVKEKIGSSPELAARKAKFEEEITQRKIAPSEAAFRLFNEFENFSQRR